MFSEEPIQVNNNDKTIFADIRKSIVKHYDKVNIINKIYNNYIKYLSENFKKEKFKYNFLHINFLDIENENFKLYKKCQLIANSDNYVIYFIIKPKLNKLNFNDIIFLPKIHK